MASLKDLADLAGVPMLTALRVLNQSEEVDESTKERVVKAAQTLRYQARITQIDIADFAGVAKATVSYALNGSDLIKPETREKVLEAAQLLGYHMNITARNLKTNRAHVVGYSWHIADDPNRMNHLLNRFVYRITMAAEEQNYHILTFIQPKQDADLVYETLLSTSRVDGFIISDVQYNDSRIARLKRINAPFASFGGMYVPNADFAYVDVDGKYGMNLVMQHLLNLGHERIGLLTRHQGVPFGDAREQGYREAMTHAGIKILPEWVGYTPNILTYSASATQSMMTAKHPPTAIICTNDLMAFGAKMYMDERSLRVPDDVAITGYDDDPSSEFLGITSVRQPIDEVAQALFDVLMGEINQSPVEERQIVLYPELVIRKSTQKLY